MRKVVKLDCASGKLFKLTVSCGALQFYNYLHDRCDWSHYMTTEEATKDLKCTEADLIRWEHSLMDAGLLRAGTNSNGDSVVYLGHPECSLEDVVAYDEMELEEDRVIRRAIGEIK